MPRVRSTPRTFGTALSLRTAATPSTTRGSDSASHPRDTSTTDRAVTMASTAARRPALRVRRSLFEARGRSAPVASSSPASTSRLTTMFLTTAPVWWKAAIPSTACGSSRARGSTRSSVLRTLVGTSGLSFVSAPRTRGTSTALAMRDIEGFGASGARLTAGWEGRLVRCGWDDNGTWGTTDHSYLFTDGLTVSHEGIRISHDSPSAIALSPCLTWQNTSRYIDLAAFWNVSFHIIPNRFSPLVKTVLLLSLPSSSIFNKLGHPPLGSGRGS